MTINQLLFKIWVVSETDFDKISKTQLNSLSISVFGQIKKRASRKFFFSILSHQLKPFFGQLTRKVEVPLNKETSELINQKQRNKVLIFTIEESDEEILIHSIIEKSSRQEYLKKELKLKKILP